MMSHSANAPRARVALVDDHPLFRAGLRLILEREAHFAVVVDADSAASALAQAKELDLELAIVDVVLPELDGVAFTTALRRLQPRCRVLGLSMLDEPVRIAAMLRAGADGFALKSQSPDTIAEAAWLVLGGIRYLPPSVSSGQIDALLANPNAWPLERLTAREREVFQLLVSGMSNDDIASRLFIARRTVETHRNHVMHKLSAHSIVELMLIAQRFGATGG